MDEKEEPTPVLYEQGWRWLVIICTGLSILRGSLDWGQVFGLPAAGLCVGLAAAVCTMRFLAKQWTIKIIRKDP